MAKGVVRWFSNAKGYGFITGETGEDIFVHYSGIMTEGYRTLNEGQQVEFELIQGPKGLKAEKVIPLLKVSAGESVE
jgi:CspA family cold shock protein